MFNSLKSDLLCDALDPVCASMKAASLDCFYSYDTKIEQNLSVDEYKALKSLPEQDKDETKFREIKLSEGSDYNFIINQELRISKALRILKNNGSLTENTYEQLNPTGTQPSMMYGL